MFSILTIVITLLGAAVDIYILQFTSGNMACMNDQSDTVYGNPSYADAALMCMTSSPKQGNSKLCFCAVEDNTCRSMYILPGQDSCGEAMSINKTLLIASASICVLMGLFSLVLSIITCRVLCSGGHFEAINLENISAANHGIEMSKYGSHSNEIKSSKQALAQDGSPSRQVFVIEMEEDSDETKDQRPTYGNGPAKLDGDKFYTYESQE